MLKYSFLISISSLLFLSSCNNNTSDSTNSSNDTVYINDYNVLLVPDLSNRINPNIHPKPVNDTTILFNILDNVVTLIDLNNRSVNQKDIYKLDFINQKILNNNVCDAKELVIDLNKFGNDLSGASEYLRTGIKSDVSAFKSNIKSIYDYSLKNTAGADLWNYFNENISKSLKKTTPIEIKSEDRTSDESIFFKQYKNVVVIFTDGYIENANKTKGYNLDPSLIEKIRKDYLASGNKNLKEYITSNPEYLLHNTTNSLEGTNILILETIDRSLNKNGVALKQPTDFQIMKILWEQWLTDSGADKVEVHQTVHKKEEAFEIIKTFMEELNRK